MLKNGYLSNLNIEVGLVKEILEIKDFKNPHFPVGVFTLNELSKHIRMNVLNCWRFLCHSSYIFPTLFATNFYILRFVFIQGQFFLKLLLKSVETLSSEEGENPITPGRRRRSKSNPLSRMHAFFLKQLELVDNNITVDIKWYQMSDVNFRGKK